MIPLLVYKSLLSQGRSIGELGVIVNYDHSQKRLSQHMGLLVYLAPPDLVNDNMAREASLCND